MASFSMKHFSLIHNWHIKFTKLPFFHSDSCFSFFPFIFLLDFQPYPVVTPIQWLLSVVTPIPVLRNHRNHCVHAVFRGPCKALWIKFRLDKSNASSLSTVHFLSKPLILPLIYNEKKRKGLITILPYKYAPSYSIFIKIF